MERINISSFIIIPVICAHAKANALYYPDHISMRNDETKYPISKKCGFRQALSCYAIDGTWRVC